MQMKTGRVGARVVLGLVVLGLGWFIRERSAATHASEWTVAGWALTGVIMLRMGLAVRRAVHQLRRHTRNGIDLHSIDALAVTVTPSFLRGFYAMEKRAYLGAWRSLRFAPLAPAGPFSVAGGPRARLRRAVQLLALAFAGGMLGLMLPAFFTPFWPRFGAAAVLLVGVLYALVWIVGERRSLREGGHSIDGDRLLLNLGLRAKASLALQDIGACTRHHGAVADEAAWRCTPGETPNVVLQLHGEFHAVVRGNAQVVTARQVLLYVDAPADFVAAVNAALAAQHGQAREAGEIATAAALSL